MKKLLIIAFAVASLATAFTSCKKDASEEELLKNQLAQADSLLKRGGVIKYTVKVVSTANSSMLKSKMSIENASVTVYQNDKVFTGQTDAMGFVTFDNMRVGTVAVNVTLKDHAEVDYVADITPQEQLSNFSQSQVVNTIRYASTMVPMFPIADPGCATITGKVTAELDLTNTTPEPAPGVKVTATVDVDDPDFVSRYIAPTLSSGTPSAGRILKYAFSDATITATTDALGVYTLKVPASLNGLPIKLSIDDYQTMQKLYLENDPTTETFAPAIYNVPVVFSYNIEPSSIPEVKPVYLEVEDPICPLGLKIIDSKFSFTVDADGGINSVTVINKGKFTNKPHIVAYLGGGQGAELEANFNNITGEVESVTIIKSGKGYKEIGSYVTAFIAQNTKKAEIEPVINKDGIFNGINIINKGYGYISDPNIKITNTNTNSKSPTLQVITTVYTLQVNSCIVNIEGFGYKNIKNTPNIAINGIFNLDTTKFKIITGQVIVKNLNLGTGKI